MRIFVLTNALLCNAFLFIPQLVATVAVSFVAVCLLAYLRPYKRASDNHAAVALLVQVNSCDA